MNRDWMPDHATHWTPANAFSLLENGEAYFPRVFEIIAQARKEVLIETFILFDDRVGQALQQVLITAAERGILVKLLIDGYGSGGLSRAFLKKMTQAGIRIHIFDPQSQIFGLRTNVFRRMHRKIVVVDGEVAFMGGINFSEDHLLEFGPGAKQDYAVEIRGPIVVGIQHFVHRTTVSMPPSPANTDLSRHSHVGCQIDNVDAMFVVRDNDTHRNDIEDHYRAAIRRARSEIIIANAYFFPGYRLLREIRHAAKRGVRVYLILQGEPDLAIVKMATAMLYDYLNAAGVRIYEYCRRPLHGKVACVDSIWATVGSSNLDPLSLALNLEANVMIRNSSFASILREHLWELMVHDCHPPKQVPARQRKWRRLIFSVFVYHFLRRFPAWAGLLPAHKPKLKVWEAPTTEESDAW